LENEEKAGEMADKQREARAKTNIHALRFVILDVGQLSTSWISAVRNWLARKDRTSEVTMDDLTAELRMRGLEPPYDAVKQELATRFAGMDEATQRKAGREFARQIGMFIRESDEPFH
jgi:hypothetical protein